jgi:hypothetical protein
MSDFDTDLIGYDKIVEQSMRGVVYNVIKKIAKEGLPGEHHVYIIFQTSHKDVILSDKVKSQYPDSIKIILQKQFEITKVNSKYFDIILSFGGVKEEVRIPFDAVLEFTDPFIRFSLNFDTKFTISDEDLEEFAEEYEEYYEENIKIPAENHQNNSKNSGKKIISFEDAKNLFKK